MSPTHLTQKHLWNVRRCVQGSCSITLKTHAPQIWGVNLQKSLVLQCFLRVTPQIWGVKCSPPNFGGMGFQGVNKPQIAFPTSISVESTPYIRLLKSNSVLSGREEGCGGGLGSIVL